MIFTKIIDYFLSIKKATIILFTKKFHGKKSITFFTEKINIRRNSFLNRFSKTIFSKFPKLFRMLKMLMSRSNVKCIFKIFRSNQSISISTINNHFSTSSFNLIYISYFNYFIRSVNYLE